MGFNRVFLWVIVSIIVTANGIPVPGGGGNHHVRHRIHVPQRIKTVYHTKIIKVPEHHHHFHEKEKIIIQKEEKKEQHHEYPPLLKEEEEDDHGWEGLESSHVYKKKRYLGPSHEFKSKPKGSKKRRVRPSYSRYRRRGE